MKGMKDKMGRALVEKGAAGKAMMGFKKGGAIDGVAKKGKTKGKMIKMRMGGTCK